MVYGFVVLVVLGILFLIFYNARNAKKKGSAPASNDDDGGREAGEAESPAERAQEAPEAVVRAEPGVNPDSFDPASLENAAAVGAIELDHPPVRSAADDLKAARQGSLDAQYRDALRRFAAEEDGGDNAGQEGAPGKSADEAYRDALRAMRRKE